jgi:general secretion pathway protein C
MSNISLTTAGDIYRRHESKIILIIVVLLSLYLLAFVAKLTWSLIPQPQGDVNNRALQSSQSQSVSSNAKSTNMSSLINLNLFGDAQAQAVVEQSQEDVTDVPETKLNLVLSGVVSSTEQSRGAAIIEYRNTQSTYGIGDKIEGTNVTLDEIYTDRVIIKNRLTRETLMLEGIDFDEANRNRNREISNERDNAQARVNTPQNNTQSPQELRERAQALRQVRQNLANEPASFADLISLSPHRANNELVGFRVSPGKDPALFNSVGLKNGDVVVQLNGLDLSNLQQAGEAITQLKEADTLQLEILRGSEFISLDLDIPEA